MSTHISPSNEVELPSPGSDQPEITPEATPQVKTQSTDQVPTQEPVATTACPTEHAPSTSVAGPAENYLRGPKRRSRAPGGIMKARKRLAEVALATGVPLAIVGLNTSRDTETYRINLNQKSLAGALEFVPDALTEQDKDDGYEVVLYCKEEVECRVNAALNEAELDQTFKLACHDIRLILEANLTRVRPNTPSLSVFWPDYLQGPTPGRNTILVVAVKEIRRMLEDAPSSGGSFDQTTEPTPDNPNDDWFAGDDASSLTEPGVDAQPGTESSQDA